MIATIAILIFVFIIAYTVIKSKKKNGQDDILLDSNSPIKLRVTFPVPEKANDYQFFKFVQYEPTPTLELIYKEMKIRGMQLKTEFEKAIQTKIKTGEFNNPLNFRDYFGTQFDLIGIHFLKGTDNHLSAFQIGICFIQNGNIVDTETYEFSPPERISKTKKFQRTLESLEFNPEFINDLSFHDVWETFELKDFLNNNLIVCWDEESEILQTVLKQNQINEYNLKFIKIKEIAQSNNLPVLIDLLLKHFNSDLTFEDSMSLIVASLAIDLKDSGVVLDNYASYFESEKVRNNSKQIKTDSVSNADFIAIDVETAAGKRWSICQIGLAIVENGELIETITEFVQPPNNMYSKANIKIHGITPEQTSDKPIFPEVWGKIFPIIQNKKLVAHSAKFDISCLHQTLTYYNLEVPEFEYYCTFSKTGQKLEDACASYNIPLENHHNAGCDAEACAKLYLKIANNFEPDYSKVKSKSKPIAKQIINFDGHDRLHGDILKPDLENSDKSSPFYNKKVVFTGVLQSMGRQEAAQILKQMGADIDTSISKRTNFVITGIDPGPSKINRVISHNNEGCCIEILYEKDFLLMIGRK
jgi:DNA polymerase III subunit epsilon